MFQGVEEVKIAKITKVFGGNGELALRLYDTFPDEVDYNEPMYVYLNSLLVPLFIKSFNRRGASKAIVAFDDINSEYRAIEFIGCEIIAFEQPQEEVEDSEIYYEMLTGYKFIDNTSQKQGTIIEFIENEHNPLFVAEIDKTEVYIPVNDDMITLIDVKKKVITFELPHGLFELYFEPSLEE